MCATIWITMLTVHLEIRLYAKIYDQILMTFLGYLKELFIKFCRWSGSRFSLSKLEIWAMWELWAALAKMGLHSLSALVDILDEE